MPANQKIMGFGDTPYASPYYSIGIEECTNLYLEKAISLSSKVPNYFISIPGLQLYVKQSSSEVCRGLYRTADQRLFGVFGNNLIAFFRLASGELLFNNAITITIPRIKNTIPDHISS